MRRNRAAAKAAPAVAPAAAAAAPMAEPPAAAPLPPHAIPFVEPPQIDTDGADDFTAVRLERLSEQIKADDIERRMAGCLDKLLEADKTQAALDAERRAQRAAAAKEKKDALAYEGAVAEARTLRQQLADALERARRAEAERDGLASERAQLQQSLAHAERVRELFASVTSRTNDVQAAADEVIQQVQARKKAEKAGMGAAAIPSGGGSKPAAAVPPLAQSATAQSARGPLRNTSNTTAAASRVADDMPYPLPRPPSTADGAGGPRKGLPSGRPGVRSALGSARAR